ncbi:hypothetical protein STRTUCAR8_08601 [Streptomyces turgidiscabies Car8]|uniref:Uncharacterized protein n=1 Tax=Streptomyces turgidiscabies (strain Car8) TaxID=698760 RepID=L7FAI2_STRT8|nr:hypothetical protein [Streptomyces turgidiscabies]ELP67665.1 hypothetical protein STRTUCAR8_08601 [Streptomyces turgidiscabies Car8]
MTTRTPLPPLPDLATLTRTTHPVLAALTPRLLGPQRKAALYDDSPYVADPEPKDGDDDGPWCRTEAA